MADTREAFEKALADTSTQVYILSLYITGVTPRSTRAIANLKEICDTYLEGRYELEVIDIYQQPELAREEEIVAAPTLIKQLPLPLRKLVGDMSDKDKVLLGLGLRPKPTSRANEDDHNAGETDAGSREGKRGDSDSQGQTRRS